MKVLILGSMLFSFILILSGCDNVNDVNNDNPTISAEISWTQDVTSINMVAVGIGASKISQNIIYELKPGMGKIYWVSEGVDYSKNIEVGSSEDGNESEESDNNVECEQEGEHEGENEGCIFSFSFSGDALTITKR